MGSILYGLMVLGGLILCVIPGIYLAIRFSFYGYLIIDRDTGPVGALKRSWEITRGSTFELFLLGVVFFGITLLGVLACVVGLFAAVPTIWIAHAHVYRRLEYGAPASQAAPAETAQTPGV